MLQSQLHSRIKSHYTRPLKLIVCRFTTDGSNIVGNFTSSEPNGTPIVLSGAIGSPNISVGRFRALRAAVRLAGPVGANVASDPSAGTITFTTAATNTYEFWLFIETFSV